MRLLGNILWILLGGLETAILWFLIGCILCITIIGIPFGTQCFKMAGLTLAPFGRSLSDGCSERYMFLQDWSTFVLLSAYHSAYSPLKWQLWLSGHSAPKSSILIRDTYPRLPLHIQICTAHMQQPSFTLRTFLKTYPIRYTACLRVRM